MPPLNWARLKKENKKKREAPRVPDEIKEAMDRAMARKNDPSNHPSKLPIISIEFKFKCPHCGHWGPRKDLSSITPYSPLKSYLKYGYSLTEECQGCGAEIKGRVKF